MTLSSLSQHPVLAQVKQAEDRLPIKNEACRSTFYLHPHPTPKVFLLLHGFTAGSYQFSPLGKAFFEAGYNVLIPRQPGHGVAGDWNHDCPPPLPTEIQVYQDWLKDWLETAQTFGKKVIVGGLSSGANLAAWIALEYPQNVARSLLFAPYFRNGNPLMNQAVKHLPIYFEWFNKDAGGNFGYKGFQIPALKIFLELADDLAQRIKTTVSAPILMVSSEADQATDAKIHWQYFQEILKQQPQSWYYRFDKSLHIGHRMMTKVEDNQYQTWINALAKSYTESDLTWQQVQEVSARMRDDQPWDSIIESLNLKDQISPDFQQIMQWSMIHDRLKCLTAP